MKGKAFLVSILVVFIILSSVKAQRCQRPTICKMVDTCPERMRIREKDGYFKICKGANFNYGYCCKIR